MIDPVAVRDARTWMLGWPIPRMAQLLGVSVRTIMRWERDGLEGGPEHLIYRMILAGDFPTERYAPPCDLLGRLYPTERPR